ncbi:MAG: hypothetical protein M0Q51_09260 [Bacteroidales bacterium]|nr:hypothetical protein [Bacteroidales bacterium]
MKQKDLITGSYMAMINISRISSLNLCLIISLFIISSCNSNFNFIHLYSKDERNSVTRIEFESIKSGNYTYFTPGLYEKCEIPVSYIKPLYSGFTSGFELIIYWENDTCNFNYYTGDFDILNPQQKFKIQKVSIDKFIEMKSDTTGRFIYQIEKSIFK